MEPSVLSFSPRSLSSSQLYTVRQQDHWLKAAALPLYLKSLAGYLQGTAEIKRAPARLLQPQWDHSFLS